MSNNYSKKLFSAVYSSKFKYSYFSKSLIKQTFNSRPHAFTLWKKVTKIYFIKNYHYYFLEKNIFFLLAQMWSCVPITVSQASNHNHVRATSSSLSFFSTLSDGEKNYGFSNFSSIVEVWTRRSGVSFSGQNYPYCIIWSDTIMQLYMTNLTSHDPANHVIKANYFHWLKATTLS